MRSYLRSLTETIVRPARSYWGVAVAVVALLVWGVGWALVGFSETWHRALDILATVTMLLLIFGLEVTQHRDIKTIHLKLDELLRATGEARSELVKMEEQSDEVLEELDEEYRALPHASETPAPTPAPRSSPR